VRPVPAQGLDHVRIESAMRIEVREHQRPM
jgi:hypothetical protein